VGFAICGAHLKNHLPSKQYSKLYLWGSFAANGKASSKNWKTFQELEMKAFCDEYLVCMYINFRKKEQELCLLSFQSLCRRLICLGLPEFIFGGTQHSSGNSFRKGASHLLKMHTIFL